MISISICNLKKNILKNIYICITLCSFIIYAPSLLTVTFSYKIHYENVNANIFLNSDHWLPS